MSPAPDLSLGSGVEDERYRIKECAVSDFDKSCSYGSSHVGLSAKSDHSNMFNVKISDFGKGGCPNPCVRTTDSNANNEGESKRRRKRALGINCRGSSCCEEGLVRGRTPDKFEELLHNGLTPDRTYKNGEHIVCVATASCATVCILCVVITKSDAFF